VVAFENFEEVWARVTAGQESTGESEHGETAIDDKIPVKAPNRSAAVRFLPKF